MIILLPVRWHLFATSSSFRPCEWAATLPDGTAIRIVLCREAS